MRMELEQYLSWSMTVRCVERAPSVGRIDEEVTPAMACHERGSLSVSWIEALKNFDGRATSGARDGLGCGSQTQPPNTIGRYAWVKALPQLLGQASGQ